MPHLPTDSTPDNDNKTGVEPAPDASEDTPPGTPRWVWVCGIIGILVVLLVIVMMLLGDAHGPGRHLPNSDTGNHIPAIAPYIAQLQK